jgi:hypothetical protein
MSNVLLALVDQIAADGRVSAEEALAVRRAVFPDGAVDRAEALALFDLAARVANEDESWAAAFVEAIGDHVLGRDAFVDDEAAVWLITQAAGAGVLRTRLLIDVLRRAECAPESLAAAAREALAADIGPGPVTLAQLEGIRTCLFALSGDAAAQVSAAELAWLFSIDAATDGADNVPAWGDLFIKAALNHVMAQRPAAISSREAQRGRLRWLHAPVKVAPLAFLSRTMEGGLETYRRRLGLDEVGMFEAHYAERLAEAEADEKLTLGEVSRLVTLVRADGKRTANEEALMAEVRRLEGAA